MTERICIISARRTPQGRYLGALSKYSSTDLAVEASKAALDGVDGDLVDQVILGNVLSAGQGMNIARQLGIRLQLPLSVPAFSVNMMCASGMKAVALGAQAIGSAEASVVLCGGAESMSNAPFVLDKARTGYRLGDGKLIDVVLRDGLVDTLLNEHMGMTAERLSRRYQISREEQDALALGSHERYFAVKDAGLYDDELAPLAELAMDEHPRSDTSLEKLASLRPVFGADGTVTAGNASGINDGAAMLVLASEETARERAWEPLAAIRAWSAVGCDPKVMGLGPVHAIRRLCHRTGCTLDAFDTIEINEAFAAQTLACLKELGLIGDRRVNGDGGAIALGHPIGTSGARLVVHLAHRIRSGKTRQGLASLCVGGGMGMAMALEPV